MMRKYSTTMRWIIFSLLMLVSMGPKAAAVPEAAGVETRYGLVDVVEHPGDVAIRFRGKAVSAVEADGASLYHVSPNSQREFVIVDAWTPGLHCHHVFLLVELYPDGKADVSNPFGVCMELHGATFHGEDPLILLSDPFIPGQARSSELTGFEWKNGGIVQVSGEPPRDCTGAADAAKAGSSPVDPKHQIYEVTGKGRLQFLSAPGPGCDQAGVFVIPRDMVLAERRFGAYTFVRYTNPKSGRSVQGWVDSGRLGEISVP